MKALNSDMSRALKNGVRMLYPDIVLTDCVEHMCALPSKGGRPHINDSLNVPLITCAIRLLARRHYNANACSAFELFAKK
jgi:hypothetical protein